MKQSASAEAFARPSPPPFRKMMCWLVRLRVGNVENNDPGLIAPIAAAAGIVYGSSISTLAQASIAQIMIDASAVRAAAPFYRGQIMGGVLRAETDALFCDRRRV